MGLFQRLKQKSKGDPTPSVTSSSRPSTPDAASVSSRPKFGTASSRRSGLGSLPRPELSPSAASSHSIASRVSKARWKDRRRSKTKDQLVGGPAYDASPGKQLDEAPLGMENVAAAGPDDLNHTISQTSDPASLPPSPIKSKARPLSMEYKQEGGILGRLNFESRVDQPKEDDTDQLHSWLGGQETERDSVVPVDKDDAVQPRSSDEVEVLESAEKKNKFWKGKGRIRRMSRARSDVEDDAPPTADGSPMRRKVSLPPTDSPLVVDSSPPTELHHPRPQTLRRPSSSFFQNTFARSLSRTSIAQDIEVPVSTEDDGSFQLKSFRHVSGTGDVNAFNPYTAQQPASNEPSSPVSPTKAALAAGIEKTTTPSIPPPPSAYRDSLPRPRIPSSRPPSVAGSVTSLDEMMIATPKITAAAFRRGVRRQSENVLTPMETKAKADDDDDDDTPLAMTRKRRMSVASMPVATIETSPAISSPLKVSDPLPGVAEPLPKVLDPLPMVSVKVDTPEIEMDPKFSEGDRKPSSERLRKTSISPSPSFTLLKRAEQSAPASRGFVVKSATSTRQERVGNLSRGQSISRPPVFESPISTKPSTPAPLDEPEILLSPMDIQQMEKTLIPPLISPSDKRAQSQAPIQSHAGRSFNPPAEQEKSLPISARSPPPPVAPLVLPEPGDTTPSSTDLPLPPDQMPATPPPISGLPSRPPSPTQSSGKKKTTLGILEGPLRVISAFWAASPPDSSPEKTARRVSQPVEPVAGPSSTPRPRNSIARPLSVPLKPSSPGKTAKVQEDELELWAVSSQHLLGDDSGDDRAPSRMTLFDASAAASPSLANRRSSSSMNMLEKQKGPRSRASLSSINTNIDRVGKLESATGAPSTGTVASSFRAKPQSTKPHPRRGKVAWSSSESDSGDDTESPPARPPARAKGSVRRVPAGPRKAGSAPSSPEKARKTTRRVSGPRAPRRPSVQRRKIPSDSSSGDEKLSTLRERVSSSRLSQYKVSPTRSTVALPASPRRHQPSASTSTGFSGSPPPPPVSARSASYAQAVLPRQSDQTQIHGAGRPSFHRTATSPHSSWSGSTSSSPAQPLVTPRSGDYPATMDGQGGYTDTEPRQRRLSTASSHWSGMAPAPVQPGMDPRMVMKQAWQAHFMAAAYRASEEEWERASSIGGDQHSQSPIPPSFPSIPFGLSPFPYGYPMPYPPAPHTPIPYPYHPGMGMTMMPPYPSPQPHPHPSQFPLPPHDMGYQFAPTSQSVFGGDFGPPSQSRQGPVSPSATFPGQYHTHQGPPSQTDQADRSQGVKSTTGTRVQYDNVETPRRTRRSSKLTYAN